MNAKNDFQIDPEDFREIVAKRRDQLRRGMMMYEMTYNNNEQYLNPFRTSINPIETSPHSSSLYSMNMRSENRSNDPLVDDYDSEKSSYAKKKLMKNIARNTKRMENYFYDDAVLHFDDEYAFDGSILYAKRRKSIERNWDEYACEMPKNQYGADQVSNDGSYGYYLPDDEEQEQYFVNDTLTLDLPPHRASI